MSPLDVVGIYEIAEIMRVDPGVVYVWHQRGKLPKEDAMINGQRTKVWRRSTIRRWKQQLGGTE